MAATCPHGLSPTECLICPHVVVAQVVDRGPAPARRSHPARRLFTVAAAIAVVGVTAWVVAGFVFALVHLFELIAVALVAGWAGYQLGHFRGRRQQRLTRPEPDTTDR